MQKCSNTVPGTSELLNYQPHLNHFEHCNTKDLSRIQLGLVAKFRTRSRILIPLMETNPGKVLQGS